MNIEEGVVFVKDLDWECWDTDDERVHSYVSKIRCIIEMVDPDLPRLLKPFPI
jgi:hypothetical protein